MITIEFKNFDDMLVFAKRLTGDMTAEQKNEPPSAEAIHGLAARVTSAPAVQQPVHTAPIQQPVYTASQTVPVQQVPTTAPSYTLEDLTRAAIPLMDSGKQPALLQLLKDFGVEALPSLRPDQFGAFATALRGLGAQI